MESTTGRIIGMWYVRYKLRDILFFPLSRNQDKVKSVYMIKPFLWTQYIGSCFTESVDCLIQLFALVGLALFTCTSVLRSVRECFPRNRNAGVFSARLAGIFSASAVANLFWILLEEKVAPFPVPASAVGGWVQMLDSSLFLLLLLCWASFAICFGSGFLLCFLASMLNTTTMWRHVKKSHISRIINSQISKVLSVDRMRREVSLHISVQDWWVKEYYRVI